MQAFNLFLTFFKIGLFTFGGGQAMIPLIMKEVEANKWFSCSEMLDFIAISESTPGPFAINIATYTGYTTQGVLGAFAATVGVILPSFMIITSILLMHNILKKNKIFKKTLNTVSSSVTGIIFAVFASLSLLLLFNIDLQSSNATSKFMLREKNIILLLIIYPISKLKINGKKISAVALILISGLIATLAHYL